MSRYNLRCSTNVVASKRLIGTLLVVQQLSCDPTCRHFAMTKEVPPTTIVRLVLSMTKSPLAFERFCVKHYSSVEGITYVPTSYNYDHARDARTEFSSLARGTSYICASCTEEDSVEKKAEDDLAALLRHDDHPGTIRFCFTAAVTELKRDRILKRVQKLTPRTRAEVVGLVQLEESISRSPSAFEEVFDTELAAIKRFQGVPHKPDNTAASMRAALSTQPTHSPNRADPVARAGVRTQSCLQFDEKGPMPECGAPYRGAHHRGRLTSDPLHPAKSPHWPSVQFLSRLRVRAAERDSKVRLR